MRDTLTPPFVAQALIAAAAPPADYECIAGDLQEEYIRRAQMIGVPAANRWYWSQTLQSIPPLLSYSRVRRSLWNACGTAFIVVIALVTLLVATEGVNDAIHSACANRPCGTWAYFTADWITAALFGAAIALLIRSGGVRVVLWSALALVGAIVVPTLLGYSSRLPLLEWLLLFGAVPAMAAGAAFYQIIRRRRRI